MINIEQRLLTLFENQRIVFWYDNNAELQEQFESIALEGVQKLIINNNEFGIKIEVLSLKPHDKFLIYSPTLAPKDEANWLLDLNIANYMFSADKTTLVLQNIGLDVSFREFVNRFDKFFNAPSRTDALKALIGSHENQESLALKMMALSIGSDDNLESIMFTLFADEKHFEILVKYGLEKEFFKAVKRKFAYDGQSVKDLLYKLLQNHFYYYLYSTKFKKQVLMSENYH